jgi:hypothetical protein
MDRQKSAVVPMSRGNSIIHAEGFLRRKFIKIYCTQVCSGKQLKGSLEVQAWVPSVVPSGLNWSFPKYVRLMERTGESFPMAYRCNWDMLIQLLQEYIARFLLVWKSGGLCRYPCHVGYIHILSPCEHRRSHVIRLIQPNIL